MIAGRSQSNPCTWGGESGAHPELIAEVYGVRAAVTRSGPEDRPYVRYLGSVA
ncbi:hypothetical protein [Streptomyces lutosisoli]|uniref:Uncharacterized protein n=1 Tax=Streptomyces lutosisoli TaxID=2665721 RepID=A0ABW2VSZ4_9ACTN